MSLFLGSSVLVPLLKSDLSSQLGDVLFTSSSGDLWQLCFGLWIFLYIRSTLDGIHFSLQRQLLLAFAMSLVGDQILLILGQSEGPAVFDYVIYVFGEFMCAAVPLTLLYFLPESVARAIVKYTTPPAVVLGAAVESRMFYMLPHFFERIDQSLLLISSLALLQWNQIVDAGARYLTGQRSVSVFATFSIFLRVVLSAATVFAMSRHSALSPVMGIYPFEFVARLLVFALLYFYGRAALTPKISLNQLRKQEAARTAEVAAT
jgi:hypothetical protein